MVQETKTFRVELKNDLLMVKNKQGDLLKGMVVPVWNAVEKFKGMVQKLKDLEEKKGL